MTLSYELDPANKFKERLRHTGIYVLDVETHKTETFDGKELLGVAVGIPNGLDLDTFYFSPQEFVEIHDLLQVAASLLANPAQAKKRFNDPS